MNESIPAASLEGVAAYIGIDWADQKHDVVLRSAAEPNKVEHRVIEHQPGALMEWIGQLQQRFGGHGQILVCLEQSRGALIHHLMGYGFLELYPVNPLQLARYRETFSPGGAKDDQPDAELLCELLYCHRDRLRAWKADSELTRKLAFFNEGRREAVDERTRLSNAIKSQLKVYFPLALELLNQDSSTALAADLLLRWPSLEALQKQIPHRLRKFFYAHNCRGESTMLERLELVQQAQALTQDSAVIEPATVRVQMLARQLKNLLPDIARYDQKIAELFAAHPDRFLFENLPGAGRVLAPRLLSALGSDPNRWESAQEIATLYGVAPVRRALSSIHISKKIAVAEIFAGHSLGTALELGSKGWQQQPSSEYRNSYWVEILGRRAWRGFEPWQRERRERSAARLPDVPVSRWDGRARLGCPD